MDVVAALLLQAVDHPGKQRHVRARHDGQADGVDVLLDAGLDDLVGGLVQARVDDLETRVAQGAGDDFGAPVVAVQAGLGDYHSIGALHGGDTRR